MLPPITELVLAFLAGGLTTLSPCVLPILPFVVGGAARESRLAPIALCIGLLTSFVVLGWSLAAFGNILGFSGSVIRLVSGLALALMGTALIIAPLQDLFTRALNPISAKAESLLQKTPNKSGFVSQLITGLFLGAIWSPCSGPTLGSAIALAAKQGGGPKSGLIMLFFGVGAVIPLLAIGYGAKGIFHRSKSKILESVLASKKLFGAFMLAIGLLIATGLDKKVEAALLDVIPESVTSLTSKF